MEEKSMRHSLSTLLTSSIAWAYSTLLIVIFCSAFLDPSHQVLVDINAYNEMWVEAFLFSLVWVSLTLNLIRMWKHLK